MLLPPLFLANRVGYRRPQQFARLLRTESGNGSVILAAPRCRNDIASSRPNLSRRRNSYLVVRNVDAKFAQARAVRTLNRKTGESRWVRGSSCSDAVSRNVRTASYNQCLIRKFYDIGRDDQRPGTTGSLADRKCTCTSGE
jgi:hypothetical protein